MPASEIILLSGQKDIFFEQRDVASDSLKKNKALARQFGRLFINPNKKKQTIIHRKKSVLEFKFNLIVSFSE